jgi:hypothetical protein
MAARFPYHRLPSDRAFEALIWDIFRHLLGEGLEKFSKGKDAGRDARFRGKADRFPSQSAPLNGNVILQIKWTEEESASFADPALQRLFIDKEAPKAKKLMEAGELDHWVIVSNRKRPAIASTKLEKELQKEVGCNSVHLRGVEELDGWLAHLPDIVRHHGLEELLIPFRVEPAELKQVIDALYDNRSEALQKMSTRWDFADYAGIDSKNTVNRVTEPYFKASIRNQSEPFFAPIKDFLENPRNRELADRYHEAAAELQAKAMAFRDRFGTFDVVFESLCEEICSRATSTFQQPGKKRVLRVVLHYMYANCDLGKKVND